MVGIAFEPVVLDFRAVAERVDHRPENWPENRPEFKLTDWGAISKVKLFATLWRQIGS